MSDYTCPACRGSFPSTDTCRECPWCGQPFGNYDTSTVREVRHVTNPKPDAENGGEGLAARLGFR